VLDTILFSQRLGKFSNYFRQFYRAFLRYAMKSELTKFKNTELKTPEDYQKQNHWRSFLFLISASLIKINFQRLHK